MNKRLYITGDTHGVFQRIYDKFSNREENKNIAIIILGDAGLNYQGAPDKYLKKKVNNTNLTFYCVRGNHEMRPTDVPNMKLIIDPHTYGPIYYEDEYPNINYLHDGGCYIFNDKRYLVIGGSYSVDKWYRIQMGRKWFANEQLTIDEMTDIESLWKGHHFDYVLSHTCPYSWQPTDLFLRGLNQDSVDNTMELWMDKFKDTITFDNWCFGHYHADRIINTKPSIRMYYQDIEEIEL